MSLREKKLIEYYNDEKFLSVGSSSGINHMFISSFVKENKLFTCDIQKSDKINHLQGDIEHMDELYGEPEFDMIYSGEVIEHLVYPDRFVKNCYNALLPNGILFITTPNLNSYLNLIMKHNYRNIEEYESQKKLVDNHILPKVKGHINVMSIDKLQHICNQFYIIEHLLTYYTAESDYGTNHPWALTIRKLLPLPRKYREQQIIICRKKF